MITIYIADDETWVCIGLKKLIENANLPFRVIGSADNGLTALDDIKRLKPDILLTDIRMPGLTGIELLQYISNSETLHTCVVLISGYAEFDYAISALHAGAFDYLLKPVQPNNLTDILNRILLKLHPNGIHTPKPAPNPPVNPTLIGDILSEMKNRYTENISLTGLSEKYGISSGHLSTLIKNELGLSFSEYITSKRIQKAKYLLKNEALSVEAVANSAGYHDYFYFTKAFKKNTGISPSKYRKEICRSVK